MVLVAIRMGSSPVMAMAAAMVHVRVTPGGRDVHRVDIDPCTMLISRPSRWWHCSGV